MKKSILLIAGGIIIGIIIASYVIIRYQLPTKITKFVSHKPSPSPVLLVTPTPVPIASQKSLKVAAFAWARVTEEQMKELKQRYKAEDKTDTQFLNIWALDMDKDPALYAKNEAIMEKTLSIEGRLKGNVEPPIVNVQAPNTAPSCVSNNVEYSDFTTCK